MGRWVSAIHNWGDDDRFDCLVFLPSDDPERVAQLAQDLFTKGIQTDRPQVHWRVHLVIIGCGDDDEGYVHRIGHALQAPPGSAITSLDLSGAPPLHAVNEALHLVATSSGLPPRLVVLSDDAVLPPLWLDRLAVASTPRSILLGTDGDKPTPLPIQGYGRVGIAAPVTDQTRCASQRLEMSEQEAQMDVATYGATRAMHFRGVHAAADEVDGLSTLLDRQLVDDLVAPDGVLFRPGLGDYTWADVCLRAHQAGYRAVVAEACFVGRLDPVARPGEAVGSILDRLRFWAAHAERRGAPSVCAVLRVHLSSLRDLLTLRRCLIRAGQVVDHLALLLLNDPLEVTRDPALAQARQAKRIPPHVDALLASLAEATSHERPDLFAAWVRDLVTPPVAAAGYRPPGVLCAAWAGERDIPAELRTLASMARRTGATWALALERDELIEERYTRAMLHRLCNHPDPRVRAYDVSMVVHWDTGRLYRVDKPYGDGGTWEGGNHAVRLWRLDEGRGWLDGQRTTAPYFGPVSVRPASLRLRKFGLASEEDRRRMGLREKTEDSLRLAAWRAGNGIGLHVLAYRNEEPDDLARWLDQLYGVLDEAVIVWTDTWEMIDCSLPADAQNTDFGARLAVFSYDDGAPGLGDVLTKPGEFVGADWDWMLGPSPALHILGFWFGVSWVHQPLDDNLSGARNAGLERLDQARTEEDSPHLAWALFIDPDEWMEDPLATGRALRRMALSDRWGWMLRIANHRADRGVPTISESVRMSRLDDENLMRFDGRVHEGFGHALTRLHERGLDPRWTYGPFVLQHRGMALNDGALESKLDKYERLLRLQLEDDPMDPGAWVSLGWHYLNDGHVAEGHECLQRAVACAGTSYLPFKELGFYHLRLSLECFGGSLARLHPGHTFHETNVQLVKALKAMAPPHPTLAPRPDREIAPLPAWPDEDDAPTDEAPLHADTDAAG